MCKSEKSQWLYQH